MAEPGGAMEDRPAAQPVEQDDSQATQLIGNTHPPSDLETQLLEDVQATQLVVEDVQATQLVVQATQLVPLGDVQEPELDDVDCTQLVATQINVEATQLLATQLIDVEPPDEAQGTQRLEATQGMDVVQTTQLLGSPTSSERGIQDGEGAGNTGQDCATCSFAQADEERTQIFGQVVDAQVELDVIGTQIDRRGGKVTQVGTAQVPGEEAPAAATQVLDEDGDDEIAAAATQVKQAEGNRREDQAGTDEVAAQGVEIASPAGGTTQVEGNRVQTTQVDEIATQVEGNRDGSSVATGSQRGTVKKARNWASVRAESFRNSVLKAYERLRARKDARPDEPAKLLLSWGDKQVLRSNGGASTVVDDVAEVRETSFVDDSGGTSCSAASTPSPVTQPSGNLLAMWSNNKKSTTSKTTGGSPSKEAPLHESTLGKVKKVLFAGKEKDLDLAPRSQNIIVSTALHGAGKELSYLNSQEPGEESQRNALDAVDKFLFLGTSVSQSQGDIADAASFDIPADNDPPVATTMPQVLSHAEALKMEAAAAYAWIDSQGNPAPASPPPPPDVPENQEKKDMTTLGEPPDKPLEERSQVTVPRKNSMVTKRVFLTDQAKKGRKRGNSDGVAATPEAAAPKDMPVVKIPTDKATTTRSNRKRKASLARATPAPDYDSPVLANARPARKRREEMQRQILTPDSQRRCKRRPFKILFSHSLDKEVVEQQKKIMKKLNLQSATGSSECTHFVTDKFLRTVNMLEALAVGKPVVTASWLENCRVAGCLLDEKNYILEDAKKEKEYGFSMRTTFSAAQHKLLFQGLKLYLTPNVKPPELRAIIEAAGGQVLETFDCSNHDCLAVSCKEDYELCVPLLDKGISVYSAEFLLSGIVTYHLDLSKNQLFVDHEPPSSK